MLIGGLIISVLYIIFGAIMTFKTPSRNSYFGYRTKRSLKNDQNWYYANKLNGKIMFILGNVFTITSLILIFINYFVTPINFIAQVITLIVIALSMLVPIIIIEIKLKRIENRNKENSN